MIWLLATFAGALIFGIGGFLLKVGSHKKYPGASMFLGLYFVGSAVFLGGLLVNGKISLNGLGIVFSILIGLGSYYGNSFLVKAYETGPACVTSPLMSLNIFLVIVMSALVYHEQISAWQYVGVGCMMVAVSLLSCNFNNVLIKSRMWAVFVVLAILFIFMREGGLKIAHEAGLDNMNILFFGYLFAGLLAIGKLLKDNRAANALPAMTENSMVLEHRPAFLLGSTIGIFSATGMALLAYAIERGPASVIVPVFSARNFVAVILLVIFFKEKLSPLQWLAVGFLIIGIIFIS